MENLAVCLFLKIKYPTLNVDLNGKPVWNSGLRSQAKTWETMSSRPVLITVRWINLGQSLSLRPRKMAMANSLQKVAKKTSGTFQG